MPPEATFCLRQFAQGTHYVVRLCIQVKDLLNTCVTFAYHGEAITTELGYWHSTYI